MNRSSELVRFSSFEATSETMTQALGGSIESSLLERVLAEK